MADQEYYQSRYGPIPVGKWLDGRYGMGAMIGNRVDAFGKAAFNYLNPLWGSRFNKAPANASFENFIKQFDGPASRVTDPYGFDGQTMTPEQAQAALANALSNPVAPVDWTLLGPQYSRGYRIGDVRIEDQQEQKPENPGIRKVTASTYGKTIPVSLGRRRLAGNVIQSSAMVPKLEGTFEYEIEYQIPIYEDPPAVEGGFPTIGPSNYNIMEDRPRPDPDDPSTDAPSCGQATDSPCNPRSTGVQPSNEGGEGGGGEGGEGDMKYYANSGFNTSTPSGSWVSGGHSGPFDAANEWCQSFAGAGSLYNSCTIWQQTGPDTYTYVSDATCDCTEGICAASLG